MASSRSKPTVAHLAWNAWNSLSAPRHLAVICASARSELRSFEPSEFTRTKISVTSSYCIDRSSTSMRYTYSRILRSRARRRLYFVYRGSSNRSIPARSRNGASSSVLKTSDTLTHCGSAAIFLVATTNAILLIRACSSSSLESVSSSTISSPSLSSLTSVTTASWSGCSRLNRMSMGLLRPWTVTGSPRMTAESEVRRCWPSRSNRVVAYGLAACVTANSCSGTGSSVSHTRIAPEGHSRYSESKRSRTLVERHDVSPLHLGQLQLATLNHRDQLVDLCLSLAHYGMLEAHGWSAQFPKELTFSARTGIDLADPELFCHSAHLEDRRLRRKP